MIQLHDIHPLSSASGISHTLHRRFPKSMYIGGGALLGGHGRATELDGTVEPRGFGWLGTSATHRLGRLGWVGVSGSRWKMLKGWGLGECHSYIWEEKGRSSWMGCRM